MPYAIPLYVAIGVSIPETYLYLIIGFNLFSLRVTKKNILLLSVINAIISFVIRKLPLFFGVHTFIIVIILSLLTVLITKINWWYSFISIITGVLILGAVQIITLPALFKITGMAINDLATNSYYNILFFLPSGLLLIIIYYLIKKFNFILYSFEKF